jgi:hypothetical protein
LREEMRSSEFAEDVANQVLGFGAIGDQIQGQIPQFLEQALMQVQQDRGQAIQSALDPLAAQREEAIQRSLAPIAEQRSADIQAALNPAVAGIQEQIEALRSQIPQQQAPVDVDALRQQITDEIMAKMGDRQTTPTTIPGPAPRGGGDFTPTPSTGTVPDFVPTPTTIPGPAPRGLGGGKFSPVPSTDTVPDFVPTPTTIPDTTPRTKGPLNLGGRKTQPMPQFQPPAPPISDPVVNAGMLGPVVNPEIRIDRGRFGNRMTPTPSVIPMPQPFVPTRPTRNLRMRGFGR